MKNSEHKLSGLVTDQTGATIAHARLTLSCGNFSVSATTDASGSYALSVPAGKYLLSISAANFGSLSQNISIGDAETKLNPVLQVAQLKSTITVSANLASVYSNTTSNGGTKTDLSLTEVPQSIGIVNRSLLNDQNAVKIDVALKNVAGVMPGGYYEGYDYYRIRGFDASLNVFIDGLRGGNGVYEETWGLESVEVLKGPSSALYGQSPLGGLVNIVTRKPVPDRFAHVQVTGGSFNFVDPAVDLGGSLNSSHTLYGRLAALYHSADSFVDYAYRRRYYLAPSLTWHPTPSTTLTLLGRAQRDNNRVGMPLPAVGTVLSNPNGELPFHTYDGELQANSNKTAQANQQFGYQFNQSIGEHLVLRQNARFAWYRNDWNRVYYPSYLGTDQRTLYRYPYSYHGPWQQYELDTSMQAHGSILHVEHDALLGVDFFRKPQSSISYIGKTSAGAIRYEPLDLYAPVYGATAVQALGLYSSSNTVTQATGIYLQDHLRLPYHLAATAGGRLDLAKNETKGSANKNDTGLTPRLGLTWQAVPSTSLYASFSKSFLPQSYKIYDGSSTGSNIAPERGNQWEGGAKSSLWKGRVLTTFALFQLNRNNIATSDPNHPNFYIVTGEQRSRGVELEASLHPLTGWNVTTAYSYVNAIVLHDTTYAEGTPTRNSPKNLFNVWSTYEIQRGLARGLSVGFGGRHYTDQSGDVGNTFQLPGYGLIDGSLTYRRGPAKWQVNATNITNERYYSGSYSKVYVLPGEPRAIRGTFSWNF